MSITTKQSTKYAGEDWSTWSVWLDAPQKEIATVDHVVYTLHATFPDPVQLIKTRRNGFKLTSAGWGGFRIYLKIVRKDGSVVKRTHDLTLDYPADSSDRAPVKSKPAPKRSPGTKKQLGAKPSRLIAYKRASSALPTVKRAEKERTVYISSGAADAEFTQKLKVALARKGLANVSVDNASTGEPWDHAVRRAIDSADATVFVVSGEPTLWTNVEMGIARAGGRKPVIPVLIGKKALLPSLLGDHQALRIDSQGVAAAAQEILRVTKGGS